MTSYPVGSEKFLSDQQRKVAQRWTWKRSRRFVLPLAGLLVVAFFIAPYSVMLLSALRPDAEVLAIPPSYFPRTWSGQSFVDVLSDSRFQSWLFSSLIVAVASSAVVMVVAIPAAYYTGRTRFKGRILFLGLVVVSQMFAPTSLVVGIYREFFDLKLINTYLALIIADSAFNLAFALWILHGFFAAIPKEVEEAASLDGCGRLGMLFRVMLPMARPGIVTAVIFTFIAVWNEYVVALTLIHDDQMKPLTVGFSSYVTGFQQNWSQLFAASTIAIVPVVILFALIEKHLIGGMTAGSIK